MENVSEHFAGHVAQKALIKQEGKVLLVKAPNDSKWDLPGGRIHKSEQPQHAVEREILEELGVAVTIGKPVFVGMTKADATGEERYFVAFAAELKNPEQPFTLQKDEVAEVCWMSREEIETISLFEVCRQAVKAHFNQGE